MNLEGLGNFKLSLNHSIIKKVEMEVYFPKRSPEFLILTENLILRETSGKIKILFRI